SIPSVDARQRLDRITTKEKSPPVIEPERRGVQPTAKPTRAAKKPLPTKPVWSVPDQMLSQGGDAEQNAAVPRNSQTFLYGLMIGSLGVFAIAIVVHKRNTRKRTSRLFYELN